jgi:hypothetical protein
MKTAIIYSTMTGHSRKIAQAMEKELNIPAYDLSSNPILEGIDQLFIVSGIYGGAPKPELLAYAGSLTPQQVRSVSLITSSVGLVKQSALRNVLSANGIAVRAEEHTCKGSFLVAAMFRPNQTDLAEAVRFGKTCMVD